MNYNTEIILNPEYNGLVDFAIEIDMGSNISFNGPKVSYQATAPINPETNDVWVSTVTLIQYQWIGSWVNLNLQSLL